jgi:hypothetical protein
MSIFKTITEYFAKKPLVRFKWKVIPRRTTTSGKVPSKLDHLELCLNTADGLVWIGDHYGNPLLITELTNSPKIFKERQ